MNAAFLAMDKHNKASNRHISTKKGRVSEPTQHSSDGMSQALDAPESPPLKRAAHPQAASAKYASLPAGVPGLLNNLPINESPSVASDGNDATGSKVHKQLTAHFDPVPAIIPRPSLFAISPATQPVAETLEIYQSVQCVDVHHSDVHYSDERPPLPKGQGREYQLTVKKRPFRQAELNRMVVKNKASHQSKFAIPKEVFDTQRSEESLEFEELPVPTARQVPDATLEQLTIHPQKKKPFYPQHLDKLMQAPSTIKIPMVQDTRLVLTNPGQSDDHIGSSLESRSDMTFQFEKVEELEHQPPIPDILQTSVARRMRKQQDDPEQTLLLPPLPDPPTALPASHKEGPSTFKLHPSDGKGASTPEDSKDILKSGSKAKFGIPASAATKAKAGQPKAGARDKPEAAPMASNVRTSNKKERQFSGSPEHPYATDTSNAETSKHNTLPFDKGQTEGVNFDHEISPEGHTKKAIETYKSWDRFFELHPEVTEMDTDITGTGFDTVAGPAGLRNQFSEDDSNSQFFRQILLQLVDKWTTKANSEKLRFGEEATRSSDDHTPDMPLNGRKHENDDKESGFILQDILPMIRNSSSRTSRNNQPFLDAFRGAKEMIYDNLQLLQKMNYPKYDRGPQHIQLVPPDLDYTAFGNAVATLCRKWSIRPPPPKESPESPSQPSAENPKMQHVVTRDDIINYYPAMTQAKDLSFDVSNFMDAPPGFGPARKTTEGTNQKSNALQKATRNFHSFMKREPLSGVTPKKPERKDSFHRLNIKSAYPPNKSVPAMKLFKPPDGKFSVNLVRQLTTNYWPSRFAPNTHGSDAIRPRYLQPTKVWSVYLKVQTERLRQLKKIERKNNSVFFRLFRRACSCQKPRPSRLKTFQNAHKTSTRFAARERKALVALVNRVVSPYKVNGSICHRLQSSIPAEPSYTKTGKLPFVLQHGDHKNLIWRLLLDEYVALTQRPLSHQPDDIEIDCEPPQAQEDSSLLPGAIPHTDNNSGSPEKIGSGDYEPQMDLNNSDADQNLIVTSAFDQKTHPYAVTAASLGDTILSIPVPATTKINNKKTDGSNRTLAKSIGVKTFHNTYAFASQSNVLSNSEPRNVSDAEEWEEEPVIVDPTVGKYAFSQIRPDFRWSLLKKIGGVDKLFGDTEESCYLPMFLNSMEEPPHNDFPVSNAATGSSAWIFSPRSSFFEPTYEELGSTDHTTATIRKNIRKKEMMEMVERLKRAPKESELPKYMTDKRRTPRMLTKTLQRHNKKERSQVNSAKRSTVKKSPMKAQKHLRLKELDLAFKTASEKNAPIDEVYMLQGEVSRIPNVPSSLRGSSFCITKSQKNGRFQTVPPHRDDKLSNIPLKDFCLNSQGCRIVHPRLQRSFILGHANATKKMHKHNHGLLSKTQGVDPTFSGGDASDSTGKWAASPPSNGKARSNKPNLKPVKRDIESFGVKLESTLNTVLRKKKSGKKLVANRCNTPFPGNDPLNKIERPQSKLRRASWKPEIKQKSSSSNHRSRLLYFINSKKYGRKIEIDVRIKSFMLNDNFWCKKPPFLVALQATAGKPILPDLVKYLQDEATRQNQQQTRDADRLVPTNNADFTFRPNNQSDAEGELVTTRINEPFKVHYLSRILRIKDYEKISDFLQEGDHHRNIIFSPKESNIQRGCKGSVGELTPPSSVIHKPGWGALFSFVRNEKRRRWTRKFARRYTGEYRFYHIKRSLVKHDNNIVPIVQNETVKESKAPSPLETKKSVDWSESDRSKSPHQRKKSGSKITSAPKRRNRDGSSGGKSEGTLETNDSPKTKNTGRSTAMKREGPVAAPDDKKERMKTAAGVKERKLVTSIDFPKKPIEAQSLGFVSGRSTPTLNPDKPGEPVECGPLQIARQKMTTVQVKEEMPTWWLFDPVQLMGDPSRKYEKFPDGRQLDTNEIDSVQEMTTVPFPSAEEKTFLGLVDFLSQKLSNDPTIMRRRKSVTRNGSFESRAHRKQDRESTKQNEPDGIVPDETSEEVDKAVRTIQTAAENPEAFLRNAKLIRRLHPDPGKISQDHPTIEHSGHEKQIEHPELDVNESFPLRVSANVALGPNNYSWQLPSVLLIRKQTKKRLNYYNEAIRYLRALLPQTGSEVILTTLKDLQYIEQKHDASTRLPRTSRKRRLVEEIDYLLLSQSEDPLGAYRRKITAKLLRLELMKLRLEEYADKFIRKRQQMHNSDQIKRWHRRMNRSEPANIFCNPLFGVPFERTPPPSPSRHSSPKKSKTDANALPPNEEENAGRKGKADKKGDKDRVIKKGKDGKTEDTKKARGPGVVDSAKGKSVGHESHTSPPTSPMKKRAGR